MNFEVGSAASYREFIISPLGAHSRRFKEAIPQEAMRYFNYPFFPIVDGRNDYTGWAVIGQTEHSLDASDSLHMATQCLLHSLLISGWEIPNYELIYEQLQKGMVVCLFLRKHFTLREMIILYPASRMDVLYPRTRGYWEQGILSEYYNLEF